MSHVAHASADLWVRRAAHRRRVWFICFPLSVYTLSDSGQFPLDYFGVHVYLGFPLDFFLPKDMWRAVAGICAAFTLYGLVTIYFNVRKLRRLRRREK